MAVKACVCAESCMSRSAAPSQIFYCIVASAGICADWACECGRQVNARKVQNEPNVLAGVLDNRLFLGILGGEVLLQVRSQPFDLASQALVAVSGAGKIQCCSNLSA